jgi:dUTP pyrophosphatase
MNSSQHTQQLNQWNWTGDNAQEHASDKASAIMLGNTPHRQHNHIIPPQHIQGYALQGDTGDIHNHTMPTQPAQEDTLLVQKLSKHATIPFWSTPESAGLDLFSAVNITVPPHTQVKVPTDIAISPPPGIYCQILPHSGLVLHHQLESKSGTIDHDYTRNIMVILYNSSSSSYTVHQGD